MAITNSSLLMNRCPLCRESFSSASSSNDGGLFDGLFATPSCNPEVLTLRARIAQASNSQNFELCNELMREYYTLIHNTGGPYGQASLRAAALSSNQPSSRPAVQASPLSSAHPGVLASSQSSESSNWYVLPHWTINVTFQGSTKQINGYPNFTIAWLRDKVGREFCIPSAQRRTLILRQQGSITNLCLHSRKFLKTLLSNNCFLEASIPGPSGGAGVRKDVANKAKKTVAAASSSRSSTVVSESTFEELLLKERITGLNTLIPQNCTIQEIVNACSAIKHLSTAPPKFFEALVKTGEHSTNHRS